MTSGSDAIDRWASRIRLGSLTLILIALAFVQAPGWIAPDTKLDLTENPGGLLARALVLWDPSGAGGQLQNQAYGYLFPMGPFFWIGDVLGLPGWLIQRLWWALILVVGFHGALALLDRLRIGTSTTRVIAAFAYALAPRMLMGLGAVSAEIWPMAMAPWVIVPLVRTAQGTERAAAIWSGVAVLLIGAVNATATLAAVIPAGLWILSRASSVRWRLMAWWVPSVILASLWWIGPLVLLGRYSPPFLDWIENAAVTSAAASLPEALRGTTQWLAGIAGSRGPLWIAGFGVLTSRATVALGMLLAVLGLLGLWRSPRSWAAFARTSLIVGLLLVTAGRVGASTGVGAGYVAALLDGPLTPLRNTHKFEPLIRIALVCGLAHVLPRLYALARLWRAPWPRLGYLIVVIAIIGQTAFPALTGVSQRGRYIAVPDYWTESAQWLADHADGGRTLVLPGSNPATSVWGDPRDEPMQAVGMTPWIVRDAVPLGSAGAIRILNDIEARVMSGFGGEELAESLARLGVSRVLLRADLFSGGVNPTVVRHALVTSGATHAAAFGPFIGGSRDPEFASSFGMDRPLRAIEILDLAKPGTIAPATLVPVDDLRVLSGGPEGAARVVDRLTVLASDEESVSVAQPVAGVLSDTMQRREATFSAVRDNYGPLLTADDEYVAPRNVHDWLPRWVEPHQASTYQTTRVWSGVQEVTASSSLALPGLGQPRRLRAGPESAFDPSGDTAWQSSGADPVGQWVEARWTEPLELPDIIFVVIDPVDGADIAAVTVRTDQGETRTPVSPASLVERDDPEHYAFPVAVPSGPTTRIRITVADVRDRAPTVRVWDVGVGSVPRAETWAAIPAVDVPLEEIVMEVTGDRLPACTTMSSGVVVCNPGAARQGEEAADLRRLFSLPDDTDFSGSGTVYPRSSNAADRFLERLDGIRAEASSRWVDGASVSPHLVLDGDDRTYWASDPDDSQPSITLQWPAPRLVQGMQLSTHSDVAGRRPTEVTVVVAGAEFTRAVPEDGLVRLPASMATELTVTITETTSQTTATLSQPRQMPMVLGELTILGDAWSHGALTLDSPVEVPCGFGPQVQVAGQVYPTSVSGTRGQLIAGDALELKVCETISVPAGTVRARMIASSEFEPRSLRLTASGIGAPRSPHAAVGVDVISWQASDRMVTISEPASQDAILAVRENANDGWVATIGGRRLEPVTVDGWAQGWLVPAGTTGEVSLTFTPQSVFRWVLVGGLVAALLLVGLSAYSAWAARRLGREETRVAAPAGSLPFLVSGPLVLLAGLAVAGPVGGLMSVLALLTALALKPRRVAYVLLTLSLALLIWCSVAPWPSASATNRDALSQVIAWSLVALVWGSSAISDARQRSRAASGDPEDRPLEEVPAEG